MTSENIYIHVPFCNGKCGYCAFYSEPAVDRDLARLWLNRISDDLLGCMPDAPVRTVYIGGGTPTALPPDILEGLMEQIRTIPLSADAEVSCECNPGSLTSEKAGILAGTVNRVSMGAQSFHEELLRRIGRRTSPEQVAETFRLLRDAGIPRIGLDLICALPGETMDQWESDLKTAMTFRPEHVSAYMLIPEPGTPYVQEYGPEPPLPEEVQADMWELAGGFLASRGLPRYEISNHAAPDAECRHNQNVWHGETLLGLGPSASSFDGSVRKTNAKPLAAWLSGAAPELDEIPAEQRKREIFIMGLRTVKGWDSENFSWGEFLPELELLASDGLIELTQDSVCPTDHGLLCWNTIAETLI